MLQLLADAIPPGVSVYFQLTPSLVLESETELLFKRDSDVQVANNVHHLHVAISQPWRSLAEKRAPSNTWVESGLLQDPWQRKTC